MSGHPVDISVVVPCLDERDHIGRCIGSLLLAASNVPSAEVLIVDGMSTDGTREIITSRSDENDSVYLLDNPHRSTPHALNIGLRAAKGMVKVILGAHSEVAPDFLQRNLELLAAHPEVECVGGVLENVYEDDTSKAIGCAMSSSFGVGNAHFRTGGKEGEVDTVAFGAYRAEVFDRIGYFDEDLVRNQDDEFNYRLTSSGGRIFLSPAIKCKYYVRASFSKLARQYRQYGLFKVLVNKKHGSITTWRQLIPLLFLCYLLILPILIVLLSGLSSLWAFPLVLYAVLGVVEAVRCSKSRWYQVFYAFLILHLSYGLGYLQGIFRFIVGGHTAGQAASSR